MRGPTDGIVLINSKNIKKHANEIMNDMGLCTQENMLFPGLTVGEQWTFFAMVCLSINVSLYSILSSMFI